MSLEDWLDLFIQTSLKCCSVCKTFLLPHEYTLKTCLNHNTWSCRRTDELLLLIVEHWTGSLKLRGVCVRAWCVCVCVVWLWCVWCVVRVLHQLILREEEHRQVIKSTTSWIWKCTHIHTHTHAHTHTHNTHTHTHTHHWSLFLFVSVCLMESRVLLITNLLHHLCECVLLYHLRL